MKVPLHEPTTELRRNISLAGATALVVGGVIGAGIYVLIHDITLKAGSTAWLAFVLAMFVSLIGALPVVQIGGALPRAGGGYFFTSRLVSPAFGVIASWWIVFGGACSTCVVALTLAEYLRPYLAIPLSTHVLAGTLVVLFYVTLQFGVRPAVVLQLIMAAQFITALAVYGFVGLVSVPWHVSLTPPQGWGAFAVATLLCYTTCLGFQVIVEMGEEIIDARRNIPLALLIGGAVVALIYIAIAIVYTATVPLGLSAVTLREAPLNASAQAFLPTWFLPFLTLGAVTAALTSLNAAAIALPRELFAQARDGALPRALAYVSPRTHSPTHAVTCFFGLVLLLLALGLSPDYYGLSAAIGILAMSGLLSIAALRLPQEYPEHYARAYIVLPWGFLVFCMVFTVLVSVLFAFVLIYERPQVLLFYCGVTLGAVAVYWGYARRRLTASA
jgi:APA family basic amino acid/polyamine antiporter